MAESLPIESLQNEENHENKRPEIIVNVMLEDKNKEIVLEKKNTNVIITDKIPDVAVISEDQIEDDSDNKKIEKKYTNVVITDITHNVDQTNQVVVKETFIINKDSESIGHNTDVLQVIDQNVEVTESKDHIEKDDNKTSDEYCLSTAHNPRPSGILISLPKKSINTMGPEIRNSKQSGINISFHKSVSRIKNEPEIEDDVTSSTIQPADTNKNESDKKSIKKVGRIKKAFLNLRSKLKKLL